MNNFIYGTFNAADHGLFVLDKEIYNAPERDVEFISVPGRNGDIVIDKGRFKNASVTYHCIMTEGFSSGFQAVKNDLKLMTGYQRLEDTFNTDEYRMALMYDTIEPRIKPYNEAAKFDIVFRCKPQRFLKEGSEAVELALVSSGGIDPSTGANTEDDFSYRMEYMTVDPGTEFNVSARYPDTTSAALVVVWYNASKGFISSQSATVGEEMSLELTVPSNAAYARVMYGQGSSGYAGATGVTVDNNGVETHYGDGGVMLINPTGFAAQPIVYLTVSGAASLTYQHISLDNFINNTSVSISDFTSTGRNDIVIDSVIGDCYSEYMGVFPIVASLNNYVTITEGGEYSDFPTLQAGRTIINTPSGVTSIKVKPGWWTV